jgi:hypothetical protein
MSSPDAPILPRKWFVAAAIAALLLALLMVGVVLRPERGGSAPPAGDPPSAGSGGPGNPGEGPGESRIFLRQLSKDGTQIPWGEVIGGDFVRLEVAGVEPGSVDQTDWRLAKDEAEPEQVQPLGTDGLAAELSDLDPGRYRWSVGLRRSDHQAYPVFDPPRVDDRAADFIVAPRVLELKDLAQTQLDGTPIPASLRTASGARLIGDVRYPGAVLEIEVKPAAVPFDGEARHVSPAETAAPTMVTFQGPVGSYHWRARAVHGEQRTEWQEMRAAAQVDFIVFDPANPGARTDPPPRPSEQRDGEHESMGISGGGGGRSGPLPHNWTTLPSLWSLMVSTRWLVLACIPIALAGAIFLRQAIKSKRDRQA